MPMKIKRIQIRTDNLSTLSGMAELDLEHRKLLAWLMFGGRGLTLRKALTIALSGRQSNATILQNQAEISKFYEDKILYFNNKRVA